MRRPGYLGESLYKPQALSGYKSGLGINFGPSRKQKEYRARIAAQAAAVEAANAMFKQVEHLLKTGAPQGLIDSYISSGIKVDDRGRTVRSFDSKTYTATVAQLIADWRKLQSDKSIADKVAADKAAKASAAKALEQQRADAAIVAKELALKKIEEEKRIAKEKALAAAEEARLVVKRPTPASATPVIQATPPKPVTPVVSRPMAPQSSAPKPIDPKVLQCITNIKKLLADGIITTVRLKGRSVEAHCGAPVAARFDSPTKLYEG